jgi:glycosyltransferase involved in cell wall biosynthesis
LLYVGRLSPFKGLTEAIKSLSMLNEPYKDVKLLIVGPPNTEAYYQYLRNLVLDLDLKDNVIFTGNVKHSDLPYFYAASDLLLFPTKGEGGTPNVLLEAMASGLPIITSNIPAINTILSFEDAYMTDTTNPRSIAEAIVKLLDDNSLRSSLARNARLTAEKEFSWEIVCNKFIHLIKNLGQIGN